MSKKYLCSQGKKCIDIVTLSENHSPLASQMAEKKSTAFSFYLLEPKHSTVDFYLCLHFIPSAEGQSLRVCNSTREYI